MEETANVSMTGLRINGMAIPPNLASQILIPSNFLVALLGIPGNLLVILAVVLSKRVQTVSSVFIVNLAVADLMTCSVAPMFSFVQAQRFYHSSLEPICQVVLVVVHSCIGASMYSLSAIALNRFSVIFSSRWLYGQIYQPKFIALQLVVIWIIPMSVAILPSFVFGIGQQGYELSLHTCAPVKDHPTTAYFNDILTYVLYPIPLLVIISCYIAILVKVIKHTKSLARHGVTKTSGGISIGNEERYVCIL